MPRFCLVAILISSISGATLFAAPDFDKEVAPILEANCLFCHDPEGSKGDLSLGSRKEALLHPEALIPGKPEESLLFLAISGSSPEMPKKAAPLPMEEVEILRKWIEAGAPWPEERRLAYNPKRDLDWWSLSPIQQGQVPEAIRSGPSINPVDFFVDARISEKGLVQMEKAEPETLLRRITYDLTGLPPTAKEIEAFLANPDWEGLVDRLLESTAFGEKFGRHWLDVARYAETHGYDKDKPRWNAWPYRDYVIRSFNEDKPFSRFVQEQIAGDILFPETPDGIVGLGFLAAGPWDFISHWEVGEGKLDGRIAKHLDRDEMIRAVFETFQATTVGCAQCHHHKFDPIRMEDYYRLHAVFAAVDRADRVYEGLPPAEEKRRQEIQTKLTSLRSEQGGIEKKAKQEIAKRGSGIDHRIAELKKAHGTKLAPEYGYHSHITKNQEETKWVQIDLGKAHKVNEIRILPAYDTFAGIGAGFGFPVRYRVEVSNDPSFRDGVRTLLDATERDQTNPGTRTQAITGDERPFRYLRVTATKLAERTNDFIFALGEIELVDGEIGDNLALNASVSAKDSIESGPRWRRSNLVDGIYHQELADPEALAELHQLEERRKVIENEVRTPQTKKRLSEIRKEIGRLEKEQQKLPKGKTVYAASTQFTSGGKFKATGGKPRPIHLLHRGDLRSPQDPMSPGAPPLWGDTEGQFFDQKEWNEAEARAALAEYLTQHDNPLLWRTMANRLWQWVFGQPLVGTPNDFGRGGQYPSHPELLDFLAAQLRDDPNQSLKSILRLLLTSEVYRRSSRSHAGNEAIDGSNAFLWRANRRRLTAEEIRDSLLLVSGNLDRTMGGPSFQDFVIEKPQHSPHYQYHLHDPADSKSHRRTVYRFVVRSQPNPMLTSLDCADPSMSVPSRDESTTALQALTQWNHRFVATMASSFAENALDEAGSDSIAEAYRQLTGRFPNREELEILQNHLEEQGPESLARVLFNMSAFVYVD